MSQKTISTNPEYQVPDDWRGALIQRIRVLMQEANSEIVEEVKYKTASNPNGVLVWYCDGMLMTGEVYKEHLRLSLSKGNLLKDHDPKSLINSYRAILLREENTLDEAAFTHLIRAAVQLNHEKKKLK